MSYRLTLIKSHGLALAAAQGFLLTMLLQILDSWMPMPKRPDLAWACLLAPCTTLGLALIRRLNYGLSFQIVTALGLLVIGLAMLFLHFFNPSAPVAKLNLQTGHYTRLVLMVLGASLAWIQGWRLAFIQADPKKAVASLQWGVVCLGVIWFIGAQGGNPILAPPLAGSGFIFFSFLSLWLNQAAASQNRVSLAPPGAGLCAFCFGFFMMGILALLLWSLAELSLMKNLYGPAGMISYLGSWLLEKFNSLVFFFFKLFDPQSVVSLSAAVSTTGINEPTAVKIPPISGSGAFSIFLALFILGGAGLILGGYLCFRMLAWLSKRQKTGNGSVSKGRWSKPDLNLIAVIKKILKNAAAWIGALAGLTVFGFSPSQPKNESYYYQRLLVWAEKRGFPKHPSQTPYEFLTFLADAAPNLVIPLKCITECFVRNRYGPTQSPAKADPEIIESYRILLADKSLRRKQTVKLPNFIAWAKTLLR